MHITYHYIHCNFGNNTKTPIKRYMSPPSTSNTIQPPSTWGLPSILPVGWPSWKSLWLQRTTLSFSLNTDPVNSAPRFFWESGFCFTFSLKVTTKVAKNPKRKSVKLLIFFRCERVSFEGVYFYVDGMPLGEASMNWPNFWQVLLENVWRTRSCQMSHSKHPIVSWICMKGLSVEKW